MSGPNRFSQFVNRDKDEDEWLASESDAWEHARVRRLFKKLGFSKKAENFLSQKCEDRCGDPRLRFDVFNDEFADFPFAMASSRLRGLTVPYGNGETSNNYQVHRDVKSLEVNRFKRYEHVPYVIAFRELQENVSENNRRPLALVFPRKGLRDGMVIHNDDSEQYWDEGLCWVFKNPVGNGEKLYAQPFDDFLSLMEGVWHPG